MRALSVIEAPFDYGGQRLGTVDGPTGILDAGLIYQIRSAGFQVQSGGRVDVRPPLNLGSERERYKEDIFAWSLDLARRVEVALLRGENPLILGGDHSLGFGSLLGVSNYLRRRNERMGVLWIDAHGDINTPDTTPSGNLHGMPLAYHTGLYKPQELPSVWEVAWDHLAWVGVRDLDGHEPQLILERQLTAVSPAQLRQNGIEVVMNQIIKQLSNGTSGMYVSVDLDVLDPAIAPGVGTRVAGGLSERELREILRRLGASGRVLGIDFVETNPSLDEGGRTSRLAVDMAAQFLAGVP